MLDCDIVCCPTNSKRRVYIKGDKLPLISIGNELIPWMLHFENDSFYVEIGPYDTPCESYLQIDEKRIHLDIYGA